MNKRKGFTFQCFYCVADFGDVHVTIESDNLEEAKDAVDEWCIENNCNDYSGFGVPRPQLVGCCDIVLKN